MPIDPIEGAILSYARCVEISKRMRWDIDKDVIRGRNFDSLVKSHFHLSA